VLNAEVPLPLIYLLPLLAVAFDVYCLARLYRARSVERLSKAQWAAVICVFTPFGGISFLMLA
jgi:hypothetical protein